MCIFCIVNPVALLTLEGEHSPNELRIVLSWGAKPLELDAHVYTSEGAHVEYRDAGRMTNGIKLDMDSSAGYGPETVTIKVSPQLGYSFSVYWPGVGGSSEDWNASLATVTLYDSIGPVAVFHSPPPSLGSGSTEEKWWHIFGLDGSRWNSPGHGIVRVNQRMTHDLPQLALQGWTLVESLKRGMWEDFTSQLAKTVQGTTAVQSTGATNDQPCMTTSRLALMTSLEGSTLLSLLCAHDHSTVAGGDQAKGDEDGKTPLQKQMEALKALLKGSVQLEKAAESLAAMDGGIPHELALEKEIRLRGVRDSYIYRAVMYASADVAVHVLGVLVPVVQRSSMSAIIRQFFYTNGEDLLDMCVIKRTPNDLLAVLQALLAIEAVWERKPIRHFVENDQVLFEWPQDSGNWVKGVVHKCRADAHVVRCAAHYSSFHFARTSLAYFSCSGDGLCLSAFRLLPHLWKTVRATYFLLLDSELAMVLFVALLFSPGDTPADPDDVGSGLGAKCLKCCTHWMSMAAL